MTKEEILARIKVLKDLGKLPLIDSKYLEKVQHEIDYYLVKVKNTLDSDWESLPLVSQYNQKFKNLKDADGKSWRDDTAETARRVWEWWTINRFGLHYLSRLVAQVGLIQTSSASVERVFSQLDHVLRTCQQQSLLDGLETRLMERINHVAVKNTRLKPSLDGLLTRPIPLRIHASLAFVNGPVVEEIDDLLDDEIDEAEGIGSDDET